ncbi:MAG TPA: hypothetical protein VKL22_04705, partial [Actinomycetota bacterium]|nr:hypothetical protein [Actinomycetota bacterium]
MSDLSLEEIDARIASLRAETDHIGARLGELDGDVTLKLLGSATLSGQTAAAWARAGPGLSLLWGYYGALRDRVAEIVALRGTKARLRAEQLDRLAATLTGDSVALPPDPLAPGTRTLVATGQAATIPWVLSAMRSAFQEVVALVDRVEEAWMALPRLDGLAATLTGLTQTASQNGLRPPAEVAAAGSQIAALRDRLKADPLAVDLSGLDALAGRVEAAGEILRGAAQARGELGSLLAAAAERLDGVGGLIEQTRSTRAEAREKIAGAPEGTADLDALAGRLALLRTDLGSVTQLGRGDWQGARRLLGHLDQQAAALEADVSRALAEVRDPIEARNELRGRLDAYRAKAQALGLAEDEGLSRLSEQARALLFTAPCDVAGADALVREYARALSRPRPAAQG